LATVLQRKLDTPLESAQLSVGEIPPGLSLLEVIDPDQLALDGLEVFDVRQRRGVGTQLDLGERQRAQATINRLQSRFEAVEKRL
jgi:hypothetical protein